jgi:hypothetical protein
MSKKNSFNLIKFRKKDLARDLFINFLQLMHILMIGIDIMLKIKKRKIRFLIILK